MKTWEYDPKFALRSYGYVAYHALLSRMGAPIMRGYNSAALKVLPQWMVLYDRHKEKRVDNGEGLYLFYGLRFLCAVMHVASEICFILALEHLKAGLGSAVCLCFCISPGCYLASNQVLPSSTFTTISNFVWASFVVFVAKRESSDSAWQQWARYMGVGSIVLSIDAALSTFNFAALIFLPFAVVMFVDLGLTVCLATGLLTSAIVAGSLFALDSYFYGVPTLSLLQFIRYNSGQGSSLYGVEPVAYYVRNLLINFNFVLVVAVYGIVSFGGTIIMGQDNKAFGRHRYARSMYMALGVPVPLWLAVMCALPHKEERFLYVIYPLICLWAGAVVCESSASLDDHQPTPSANGVKSGITPKMQSPHQPRGPLNDQRSTTVSRTRFTSLVVFAVGCFSAARVVNLYQHYQRPMTSVWRFAEHAASSAHNKQNVTICTGAEWYRYPSSFFLTAHVHKLGFVPSGFQGLLPAHFESSSASSPTMNDKNQEALEHYRSLWDCDFLVDSTGSSGVAPESPRATVLDLSRDDKRQNGALPSFETLFCDEILDTQNTFSVIPRVLYVPKCLRWVSKSLQPKTSAVCVWAVKGDPTDLAATR